MRRVMIERCSVKRIGASLTLTKPMLAWAAGSLSRTTRPRLPAKTITRASLRCGGIAGHAAGLGVEVADAAVDGQATGNGHARRPTAAAASGGWAQLAALLEA